MRHHRHTSEWANSMLYRLFRSLRRFFHRSRTLNNEPLNKVSLIVIILVDIFILTNVFIGLNDIGQWYISPENAYPCYVQWDNYRDQTSENKDFELIRRVAEPTSGRLTERYSRAAVDHLGRSMVCVCNMLKNEMQSSDQRMPPYSKHWMTKDVRSQP